MTTASARLVELSGLSGVSAGAHLLAIKLSGSNAGAMLVSRSSLPTATAAQHLLDGGGVTPPTPDGGGGSSGGGGGHIGAKVTLARRKSLDDLIASVKPTPMLSATDRKELEAFIEAPLAGSSEEEEELAVIMLLLL